MKKSNLLGRAEMKNVKGGNVPFEIGCYVKCTEITWNVEHTHVYYQAHYWALIPDCSPASQGICFTAIPSASSCQCLSGPGWPTEVPEE